MKKENALDALHEQGHSPDAGSLAGLYGMDDTESHSNRESIFSHSFPPFKHLAKGRRALAVGRRKPMGGVDPLQSAPKPRERGFWTDWLFDTASWLLVSSER